MLWAEMQMKSKQMFFSKTNLKGDTIFVVKHYIVEIIKGSLGITHDSRLIE